MTKEDVLAKLKTEMELRGRSPITIEHYLAKLRRLYQDYFDNPADELGEEEIGEYLHYLLTVKNTAPSSVNTYNSALRFVYGITLDRTLNYKKLPRVKQVRRLPQLLTRDEIRKILI